MNRNLQKKDHESKKKQMDNSSQLALSPQSSPQQPIQTNHNNFADKREERSKISVKNIQISRECQKSSNHRSLDKSEVYQVLQPNTQSPNKPDSQRMLQNNKTDSLRGKISYEQLLFKYQTLLKEKDQLQINNMELQIIKNNKQHEIPSKKVFKRTTQNSPNKERIQYQDLKAKNEQLMNKLNTIEKCILDEIEKINVASITDIVIQYKTINLKDQQFSSQNILELLGKVFQRIDDMLSDICEKQVQLTKSTQKNYQESLKIQQAVKKNQNSEKQYESSRKIIRELQNKISTLQAENKKLSDQKAEFPLRQSEHLRQINSLKDQNIALIKQKPELQKKVDQTKKSIVNALLSIESLHSVKQYVFINTQILTQSEAAGLDWKKYSDSIKKILINFIDQKNTETKDANEQLNSVKEQLISMDKLKNKLEKDNEAYLKRIQELQRQNRVMNELESKLTDKQNQISQKQKQVNLARDQINKIKEEIQNYVSEKIQLTNQISWLKNKLNQYSMKISELQQQKQTNQKEIVTLRENNHSLQTSIKQLQAQKQQASKKAQSDNAAYQDQIKKLKAQQERSQNYMQQKAKELQVQIQSKQQEIQKYKTEISQLNQKIIQLRILIMSQQETSQLKVNKISQKQQKIKELQKKLEDSQADYKFLLQKTKHECLQAIQSYKVTQKENLKQIQQLRKKCQIQEQKSRNLIQKEFEMTKTIKQLNEKLTKLSSQLKQKDSRLQVQSQSILKNQKEWSNNVKQLREQQIGEIEYIKKQFQHKIQKLNKNIQNNQTLYQISQQDLVNAQEEFEKAKQMLESNHQILIQQKQTQIKQITKQLSLAQNKINQLQQISCQIFLQLNQTLDDSHKAYQTQLTNSNQQYQALMQNYKQLQSQYTLSIYNLRLKEQYIKQTETYLQKSNLELASKDLIILQLQSNIQQLEKDIKGIKNQLSLEEQRRLKIQKQYRVQMENERVTRQEKHNLETQNLTKYYQNSLQNQQKRSSAQIETLKIMIAELNEANKLASVVQQKKQQVSEFLAIENNQIKTQKQAQFEQKVSQLNKIIKSLEKHVQCLEEQKQKQSFQLQQTRESLNKQMGKTQGLTKILQRLLQTIQTKNLEQFLEEAEEQLQKLQYNLSLIFVSIRSQVHQLIAQNLVNQNQLDKQNNQLQNKQKQYNQLQYEIKRLQDELENQREVNKQIAQKQQQIIKVNQMQISDLSLKLKQNANLINQNLSEKDKVQRNLRALQQALADKDKIQSELKKSKQILDEKQKILKSINVECENAKIERTKLEQQFKEQIINLKSQNSMLHKQLQNNKLSKEDGNKKSKEQQQTLSTYQSQIQKLNSQIKKLTQKNEKLEKDLNLRTQANNQLYQKIEQLEKSKPANNTNISNPRVQKQNSELKQRIRNLTEDIQFERTTVRSLEAEIQRIKEELSIQKQSNEKMERKIKNLQQTSRNRIEVGTSRLRSVSPIFPTSQVNRESQVNIARIRTKSPQMVEKVENLQKSKALFSCYSLLDLNKEEKDFLVTSVSQYLKTKCVDSNQLFAMNQNSKFRSFNLMLPKTTLLEQSYLFLFCNKGADNKNNIFAYITYKASNKNGIAAVLLLNLTKRQVYARKQNFDQKTDPIRYQYTSDLNLGGTLKIKPGDKKLECLETKSRYFDVAKNSEIFDRQVAAVDLSNMQIYQLQLE